MTDVAEVKPATEAPAAANSNGAAADTTAVLSETEAASEALRQVEFYFSDSNFPFDKFLFTLSRKDPNGWVPIATIASFKRMKPVRNVLGDQQIGEALRKSEELLEVNESGDKVRRKTELVPVRDAFDRSAYVKGFGEETPELQSELEKFFSNYGKVNSVRLRRQEQERPKKFKGSVFVEFANIDDLDKFVKLGENKEGQETPKWGDTELQIMTKEAYCQMKMKEKGIDPATASRGPSKVDRSSRKFNAFRQMADESKGKRRDTDFGAPAPPKRSDPLEFQFNEKALVTRSDGTVDPDTISFPEKSVLRFEGAGEGGNWRDLKDTLLTLHPTTFVEFPNGVTEGAVGFKESVSDDKLKEIVDKGILVGGKAVSWSRVDESRAKEFYVQRANFRANYLLDQREKAATSSRGNRGAGRGGRSGGYGEKRKRVADNSNNGISDAEKKAKTETSNA